MPRSDHANTSLPAFLLQSHPLGISFKTQALYATVFLTRYTDLVTTYVSLYNTTMKLFFIASSLYIVFLMKIKFKATNDPRLDTFQVQYVLGGAALLALIVNYTFTFQEVRTTRILLLSEICCYRDYRV